MREGNAGEGAGRTVGAGPLAVILALAAAAAAALGILDRAPAIAGALAAPAVLLGPGLALLARWSPREPSLLKLGTVAWLLSPPLFAALLLLLGRALPPGRALAAALLLVALAQGAALGVRLGADPPGKAALGAALLGLASSALLLGLFGAAPILALWGDGLWWSGASRELAAGPPFENPWLAGTPLAHRPAPAALLAALGQALQLSPGAAHAALSAWALAALPLVLYFLAAPLWGEPRRVLLGVLLGLVGAGSGAGWLALGGSPDPGAVEGFAALVRRLASAPPGGPHGLPLAPLSAAIVPGASLGTWALASLALMAAVHALRHGQRPWVGLSGIAVALALLLDPALGLAAALAIGLAALLAPGVPRVRPRVMLSVAAATLVGLCVQRGTLVRGPELAPLGGPDPALLLAGLAPLALAALVLALPALRRPAGPATGTSPARAPRPPVVLLVGGAASGALLGLLDAPRGLLPGSAALLAQVSLGTLAAGGIAGGLAAGGAARLLAGLAAGALAVGLVPALSAGVLAARAAARLDAAATFEGTPWEGPRADDPAARGRPAPAVLAAQRAEALRLLALRAPSIAPAPVLVLSEAQEIQRLRHAPVPHPAPLRAGVPLWLDRSLRPAHDPPRLGARVRAVRSLYEDRLATGAELLSELSRLDRSALLWVDPVDLERSPDLPRRLLRAGLQPFLEVGEVTLYRWTPPEAVAAGRAR